MAGRYIRTVLIDAVNTGRNTEKCDRSTGIVPVEKNRCVPYAVQCRKIRKNGRFVRDKTDRPFLGNLD